MKIQVENVKDAIEAIADQLRSLNFDPGITIVSDGDYYCMVSMGIIDPNDPLILPASRMNEINDK